jgi:hypothetical protein
LRESSHTSEKQDTTPRWNARLKEENISSAFDLVEDEDHELVARETWLEPRKPRRNRVIRKALESCVQDDAEISLKHLRGLSSLFLSIHLSFI